MVAEGTSEHPLAQVCFVGGRNVSRRNASCPSGACNPRHWGVVSRLKVALRSVCTSCSAQGPWGKVACPAKPEDHHRSQKEPQNIPWPKSIPKHGGIRGDATRCGASSALQQAPRETYATVGVCALPASKPISISRGTVSI